MVLDMMWLIQVSLCSPSSRGISSLSESHKNVVFRKFLSKRVYLNIAFGTKDILSMHITDSLDAQVQGLGGSGL